MKAIKGNGVHFSSQTDQWTTPLEIIELVGRVLGKIDLDPCSESGKKVPATKHYMSGGLDKAWKGKVYMNPPYGDVLGQWIEKLIEEHEGGEVVEAIALVPSRTDTKWFRACKAYRRCFIFGRLKFGGAVNSAPFPSMAAHLGRGGRKFAKVFGSIGDIYECVS